MRGSPLKYRNSARRALGHQTTPDITALREDPFKLAHLKEIAVT
jgi:hypothetical protein